MLHKIPLSLYGINAKNIIYPLGWQWHFRKLFKADTSAFCTAYQSERVGEKSNPANRATTVTLLINTYNYPP